jgi:hypothetical protein
MNGKIPETASDAAQGLPDALNAKSDGARPTKQQVKQTLFSPEACTAAKCTNVGNDNGELYPKGIKVCESQSCPLKKKG